MNIKIRKYQLLIVLLVIVISCVFVNTVNCNPQGDNTRKQQEQAILVNSVDDKRGFAFLQKIMVSVNPWDRLWNMPL